MGVKLHQRSDELSSKNVALDLVIHDVFNEYNLSDYDYVVTMQSISPTLKTETLDKAIAEYIQNGSDTMISVSNRARYYWEMTENGPKPLISNRINRHLLPPFYMETGAFLITKSEFIKPDTRLGEKISLFELSGDESVDVDDFGHLKLVESILRKKTIAFYVNGNNKIGLGHIYRVTELADEFFTKPDIYYDINQTDSSVFGSIKHNICPVDGTTGLFNALRENHYDCFINDILSTDTKFMTELRSYVGDGKIINFEDDGEGAKLAAVVINALYEERYCSNMSVGHEYFIASKLFLLSESIKIKDTVKTVLLTFGAADPQNYTDRLMKFITAEKYKDIEFVVILGKAKQNVEQLMSYDGGNIKILHDVSNMPELMSVCDLAITSRGRTGFELALLGVPTLCIAQNQREARHDFLSEKNGYKYIGLNPNDEMLEKSLADFVSLSKEERVQAQRKMLSQNLTNGRKHIADLIINS
jgi:spore coat polysaccharide biosynthesis predicted glycosyltransferase SpsG